MILFGNVTLLTVPQPENPVCDCIIGRVNNSGRLLTLDNRVYSCSLLLLENPMNITDNHIVLYLMDTVLDVQCKHYLVTEQPTCTTCGQLMFM